MKKHLSALSLVARMSIWKIAGVMALSAVLQALFLLTLLQQPDRVYDLPDLMRKSRMALICGVSFLLVCLLLSAAGFTASGATPGYTLRRLGIRQSQTLLCWMLYNLICLVFFWALQILIAFLLLHRAAMDTHFYYEQALYLLFYQNGFLHGLLPLAETSRWISNGALLIFIAVTLTCNAQRRNRNQRGLFAVEIAIVMVYLFPRGVGGAGLDVLIILGALGLSGAQLAGLRGWRYED